MSKTLEANCTGNVVKIGSDPIAAEILSEGVGESQGIVVMDKDKAYYITSNATDLKTTLQKLTDALTQIGTTLTSIGAGMTGPTTAPPPTLATDVAQINLIVTELTTLKDTLK